MLRLDDRWVWDWWCADTGSEYHAFYLQAPRSLGDPIRRHVHATVGHAVSEDLRSWRILPDALGPSPAGAWDDVSTWTGSTIRHDGRWYTFYTGTTRQGDDPDLIQRVGVATSDDLERWEKHPANPIIEVDPRWYEVADRDAWRETAWRDPWVFPDPDGDGFHALITARTRTGEPLGRGVVGHARSADLIEWRVGPPLSEPSDFGHLEVLQSELHGDGAFLIFCCATDDIATARRERLPDETTGTWIAPGASLVGPFDIDAAVQVPVPGLYSARAVRDRSGAWVLLGFTFGSDAVPFRGELSDPIPLEALDVLPMVGAVRR